MTARCPEPQKLAAYAHGELTDPAASEIADHVEHCDRCEATVVTLERAGDTVISSLRKQPAADPLLDEPQCQQAVELVRQLGRDPATVDLVGPDGSPARAARTDAITALGQLREYKLLEKLGEGGMGAVYKALHMKLKRVVALKILPADRLQDPHALARFEREMEAVGKLDHPHIVRAMDAGEYNGTHFLVMEYVEGADLSQLVKQRGPLPIAEACDYIRQAAVGLQHAHEHGLVHRDIKPSNLMLAIGSRPSAISQSNKRGEPSSLADSRQPTADSPLLKILDLGLALLSDKHEESPQRELTSTGQLMGTLDYMAPEQGSDSHVVDIRADIYSLGATLFKLLTGDVVYSGAQFKSPVQKMMALAIAPAPDIRTRRKDVPEALAKIVAQMLEKDPEKRPRTPAEVVALLAPFVGTSAPKPPIAKAAAAKPASAPRLDPPVIAVRPRMPAKPHAPAVMRSVERSRSTSPPWLLIGGLLALAGFGAIALAATVFYFQTNSGTLRVEVQGAETEVRVQGTDVVITAEGEAQPIKLRAGEHSLVVTRGDFTFETDKFELKRGEMTTVKVELLDGLVKVERDGQVIGRAEIDQKGDGDSNILKTFAADTPTIDRDGVTPEAGGWKIVAKQGDRTAKLFEVPKPAVDNCIVIYRAQFKTENVGKRAYLEMWCRFPADSTAPGEYFSKGFHSAATGTSGWANVEIPFRLEKGQTPDLIKLNVVIEGGGTVWIKDVKLVNFPLPGSEVAAGESPASSGDSSILQAFAADTPTIDRDGITPEAGGWKIAATGDHSVQLFRLEDPNVDNCLVVYRAKVKTKDVGKVACLMMSRRMPNDPKQPGVYITEALQSPINGTTDWTTREISFRLEKGEITDLILLNFAIQGGGTAWIKDVEVVTQPLPADGNADTSTGLADIQPRLDLRATLTGHIDQVWAVAFSPEGDKLATGGLDKSVVLWDVAKKAELRKLPGHADMIRGLAFARGGKVLASASRDKTIKLWNVDEGTQRRTIRGHGGIVTGVVFAPDGVTLLSSSDDQSARVWDSTKDDHVKRSLPHNYWVTSVAVSRDGKLVATGGWDHKVKLWTGGGEEVHALAVGAEVWSVAFSPNSQSVLAGCHGGKVSLWNTADGKRRWQFTAPADVCAVAFHPSGRFVAIGQLNGEIQLLDAATGESLFKAKKHALNIRALAFSPDGATLASGSEDKTVKLWNVRLAARKIAHVATYEGHSAAVVQALFSPDGKSIFTASHDLTLRQFDRQTRRQLKEIGKHQGWVWGLDVSRDGKKLISASEDRTIRLWNVGDGSSKTLSGHAGTITSVKFFDDDRQAISTSWDRSVRVWDLATLKNTATLGGHTQPVWDVAVTRDGKHAVSGDAAGKLRVWDLVKLEPERTIDAHESIIGFLDVSPDGTRIVSGSHDGMVRVCNLASGQPICSSSELRREKIQGVAFSPDGNMVASIDYAGLVRLTSATTGEELARFEGPKSIGSSIVFSADDNYLLAGSHGGTAMLLQIIGSEKLSPSTDTPRPATAYDRFAIGEWKPAFDAADRVPREAGATFADGVVTLDDVMIRDNSPDAVHATDMIVRAQVKGVGSVTTRCTGGNIGFWLGDGFIGINRNDPESTVLASRNYPVDLTKFHELALASVGDRHIGFIDGRRVLDTDDDKWRVRGPILIHAHQAKSEFKNIEVMSLDGLDAAKLLPERDPLAKGVGMWDTEWTHKVAGKPDVQKKGQMLVAHTGLADFYSATSTTDDGSSSLFIYKYLPETNAIRTWTFFSNGYHDAFDKAIDPETGEQTVPPRPQHGGNIQTGTMRFPENNTSEVHFIVKSPDGKVVSESIGKNTRRDPSKPSTKPSIAAAGPAKEVPELAALQPFIGRWDVDMQIKPSAHAPEGQRQTMHDEMSWVLGGRFMMGEGYTADGQLANVWFWHYDPKAKSFAMTMFQSSGDVPVWNNIWNERTKSTEGIAKDLPQGWAGIGGERIIDENRHDTWITIKDARGAVMFDMTATKRRAAAPDGARLETPTEEKTAAPEPVANDREDLTVPSPKEPNLPGPVNP